MRKCLTTDLVKAVFVVAVESSELKVIELDPSYVAIITLFSPLDVVILWMEFRDKRLREFSYETVRKLMLEEVPQRFVGLIDIATVSSLEGF